MIGAARRTLVASPAMRARLGLVDPAPEPALAPPSASAQKATVAELDPEALAAASANARVVKPPARPPLTPEAQAKIAVRVARNAEIYALLHERFPAAFGKPVPAPLMVGTRERLTELVAEVEAWELGRFLKWWTRQPGYLTVLAAGDGRVDLAGNVVGYPTPEQQRFAAVQVYGKDRAEAVLTRIEARRETAP